MHIHEARTLWQAMILGVVEGVTEYLPVSSTGHLLLTQHLLGIGVSGRSKEAADAYAICIQAGAILAVLLIYAGRIRTMISGIFGRDRVGRRLTLNVLVAFLPAAVIGLLLEKPIQHYLFGMWPVVTAWLVGGIVILLVAYRQKSPQDPSLGKVLEKLTIRQALAIGLLQCIAMWPGISRSLVTILGGMLVGLSIASAVEFSFLLGLVTLTAATLFSGLKHGGEIIAYYGWINPLLGFSVACIAAFISVKWMVGYLNRHSMAVFGYYRVLLGIVVAILLIIGISIS